MSPIIATPNSSKIQYLEYFAGNNRGYLNDAFEGAQDKKLLGFCLEILQTLSAEFALSNLTEMLLGYTQHSYASRKLDYAKRFREAQRRIGLHQDFPLGALFKVREEL